MQGSVAVANAKDWRLSEIASSCVVTGISLDDVAKDSDEGLGSIPRTRNSGIRLRSKLVLCAFSGYIPICTTK